jgi:nucleotide-binding universal stress UspA family protein
MMGMGQRSPNYWVAVRDFDRARKQAALQQLMARLKGESVDLLSYNEIREKLRTAGEITRGLREIPIDAIVGSVGRYKDFTRSFLPKRDSDEERWARVRTAVQDMSGMSPIEVYKVGEAYFVKDGNHRVSVARQLGTPTISAYVTEVEPRVPLSADDDPDEIICKSRYADFLDATNLDKPYPDADLSMTFCGKYDVLLKQIEAHRHFIGEGERSVVSFEELAAHWYEVVYLPVVELIREQGVLRNFPRLTETDLYVLFSERWEVLEETLGWKIGPETAVSELADQERRRKRSVFARFGGRLLDAIVPDELEDGPAPGRWRQRRLAYGRKDRLFADYLVAIEGSESDWQMLNDVIRMAQIEHDHLLGLHVVPDSAQADSPEARAIRDRFMSMCHDANIRAEFAIEAGKVTETIINRAAWSDLVITSLSRPPRVDSLSRIGHGFHQLIQRCPRPVLAVPSGAPCRMTRLLLAYDGSPKADEALFVAAYLRQRWPISLVVLTVETENTSAADMRHAQSYIEGQGVEDVEYVLSQDAITDAIVSTAEKFDSTMLIMGGFGFRPVLHLVLGSTVDKLLHEFRKPMLICR